RGRAARAAPRRAPQHRAESEKRNRPDRHRARASGRRAGSDRPHGYRGLNAEKDFGLKTSVIESKKQEDYVPNLTTFAQQNYDLVIAVGFLMQNAAWKVAKQFPNVKFAIIDGAPANDAGNNENLPNVANLFFKEQEAGYLVGVIAATMAKNKVGKAIHNTLCSMVGIP